VPRERPEHAQPKVDSIRWPPESTAEKNFPQKPLPIPPWLPWWSVAERSSFLPPPSCAGRACEPEPSPFPRRFQGGGSRRQDHWFLRKTRIRSLERGTISIRQDAEGRNTEKEMEKVREALKSRNTGISKVSETARTTFRNRMSLNLMGRRLAPGRGKGRHELPIWVRSGTFESLPSSYPAQVFF
jgi:hypothetical protein